jgi:hypothetical protein
MRHDKGGQDRQERLIQHDHRLIIVVQSWVAGRASTLFGGLLLAESPKEPLHSASRSTGRTSSMISESPIPSWVTESFSPRQIASDVMSSAFMAAPYFALGQACAPDWAIEACRLLACSVQQRHSIDWKRLAETPLVSQTVFCPTSHGRTRQGKGSALPLHALQCEVSIVLVNDLFGNEQPYPIPGSLPCCKIRVKDLMPEFW